MDAQLGYRVCPSGYFSALSFLGVFASVGTDPDVFPPTHHLQGRVFRVCPSGGGAERIARLRGLSLRSDVPRRKSTSGSVPKVGAFLCFTGRQFGVPALAGPASAAGSSQGVLHGRGIQALRRLKAGLRTIFPPRTPRETLPSPRREVRRHDYGR